jgi:hypothetical protein
MGWEWVVNEYVHTSLCIKQHFGDQNTAYIYYYGYVQYIHIYIKVLYLEDFADY